MNFGVLHYPPQQKVWSAFVSYTTLGYITQIQEGNLHVNIFLLHLRKDVDFLLNFSLGGLSIYTYAVS